MNGAMLFLAIFVPLWVWAITNVMGNDIHERKRTRFLKTVYRWLFWLVFLPYCTLLFLAGFVVLGVASDAGVSCLVIALAGFFLSGIPIWGWHIQENSNLFRGPIEWAREALKRIEQKTNPRAAISEASKADQNAPPTTTTNTKTGCVYVISDGTLAKIGKTTTDPQRRLGALQTGNPRKLELLHQFECGNPDRLERYLHNLFASKRERGEWFRLNQYDKTLLANLDPKAFDGK